MAIGDCTQVLSLDGSVDGSAISDAVGCTTDEAVAWLEEGTIVFCDGFVGVNENDGPEGWSAH